MIGQFFEYAVESQFVGANPVKKVKLQIKERKIMLDEERNYKPIPEDVREKFLTLLNKSEILKPICYCCLFAGLRIGEALALKWADIDFDNKVIGVYHAITEIPKFDKTGKVIARETVISSTKTDASEREVPMPNILIKVLAEWKTICTLKEKKAKISFTKPSNLVFSNNDGELRTYSGTRAMFNKLMKNTELEEYKIHFHSLRHTYSNFLFKSGENPKVIQMLLGHKELSTTLINYNSIDRSYYDNVVNLFDKNYEKSTKKQKSFIT